MNLEFDADTALLVDQASLVFQRAAPIDRFRHDSNRATWTTLREAGWASPGQELVAGTLDIGAALGLYREAGRQLLVEQYVTSGFLLSALIAYVDGDPHRFLTPLEKAPGVLLGDGRDNFYDTNAPLGGFCFGVDEGPFAVYRLNRTTQGALLLEVLEGGDVRTERLGDLSLGVGRVLVRGGTWYSGTLHVDVEALVSLRRTEVLLHSAALLGCAEAALDLTKAYTEQRVQFGVPIGSFQAVKHALADVYTASQVAWSSLLCACAEVPTTAYRTDVARLLTSDAALLAARAAAQFHGGYGFTAEAGVHYYLQTVLDGAYRFGTAEQLATRIGRTVLEGKC